MRAHVMDGDLIANTIEVESLDVFPGLIDAAIGGSVGDSIVDGVVVPKPVVGPTPEAIAADMAAYMVEVREIREKILNRLAGIGVAALAIADTTTASAVLAARTALLDITKAPAVLAATDRDSLKAAFIATYQGIVIAAPIELRNAFLLVDG